MLKLIKQGVEQFGEKRACGRIKKKNLFGVQVKGKIQGLDLHMTTSY